MNRISVFLVALLAVLAGCVSAPGTGTTPDLTQTPAAPSSPTPEDTATPTPGADELAPGVIAEGIVDAAALAAAHEGIVAADGATVELTVVTIGIGGEERMDYVIEFGPDGRPVAGTGTGTTLLGNVTTAFYVNDTVAVQRTVVDGEPRYTRHDPDQFRERFLALDAYYGIVTSNADAFAVASVEQVDGVRVVTLTGETTVDVAPGTGSAELVVNERGLVRSLAFSHPPLADYGFEVDYTVISTGDVTVERPDWVATVPADTPIVAVDPVLDLTVDELSR